MRRTTAILLPSLLGAACVFLLLGDPTLSRADDEAAPPVDYRFYKARVSPALMQYCGECHANPRKRSKMGKFFLRPAPGRRMRERYHERNFKEVLKFIEPRNPAASLLLLKALGAQAGGVTHSGGGILRDNMAEYGAIIDWINGSSQPPEAFKPPAAEEGQPDFLFFYKRIEPVLLGVCAECHEGRGKGLMKLIVHERGEDFPLEDHYTNFRTVLRLISPGKPGKSRFLTKPLAVAGGGIKHRGGDRIEPDSANHQNWIQFINGEKGPPLPTEGERTVSMLTAEGLVIQGEDFDLEGGLEEVERKGADAFYVARADGAKARAYADIAVVDPGAYTMTFRIVPGTEPLRWGFQGGPERAASMPAEDDVDEHGFAFAGPANLLDGPAPLLETDGGLRLEDGVLHMDGRQGYARWLSPSDVRHTGASARVKLAHDEEGGDDGLLLFDMLDADNGKYVGLTDGGRRFVVGVLERGRQRVLQSAKAPEPKRGKAGQPRELKVEYFGGVAVGSLDGRPLVFANLSENLGRGRFGVMSHGLLEVHGVSALEEYEVYAVKFRTGPVVDLPVGALRLWIDVPPGAALDAVHFRPSDE